MPLEQELQSLGAMSLEEIYQILGAQLLAHKLGADEYSEEEEKAEAKAWYEQAEEKLRALICGSRVYKLYVQSPGRWEWVMIVAALADLLATLALPVSPAAVAVLILKKGLDNLCEKVHPS